MENTKQSDNVITDDIIVDDIELRQDVILTSSIEIPVEFEPCENKDALEGAYLGTKDVADMLDVDRQLIITYAGVFYDYLSIYRNNTNRYKYTEEAVRQIAFLINDRANNRRTLQQELEYIESKHGKKTMRVATRGVEAFEQMFNQMQENILKQMNQNNLLLTDNYDAAAKNIQRLEDKIDKQAEVYNELVTIKDKEIETLKEQLRQKEEELELSKTKKKRGFFGFGR